MAAEIEDWMADNYRQLVAEGNSTWAQVADQFATQGHRNEAQWAREQAGAERAAAGVESDDPPKGRRGSAATDTTEGK